MNQIVSIPPSPKGAAPAISGAVPALIAASGADAQKRFLEFFAVTIRNSHTRSAYMRAVRDFITLCEHHGLQQLSDIQPMHVAAYIEGLSASGRKVATTKQHLAAIRMLGDYLVRHHILHDNPALSVKTEKLSRTRGATPHRQAEEVGQLFDCMKMDKITDYRDRAFIGVMAYTFARVSAVIAMDVKDVYEQGRSVWVRLHEKNGVEHAMPCHHQLAEYLDAYLDESGLRDKPGHPLFPSATRSRVPELTNARLRRDNAWDMVKRRAKAAGLPANTTNHTFRATGITTFLENGGTIEDAQRMAAHASITTTQVYDRRRDDVTVENVERIRY